ncbi:sulfite exporter TauE/SafE family protein [Aquabacterium sp. OR-4]|uniref:sulfite exporter TauE/SafE family protein n=1 Tax=Aquabacterium sp. OR-4 TaxID=2978127 RepID=UPI0021B1934C|nr:sulfite exporter TauE/SafE family protein [Aquabacterium sp. OR-4]MDT7835808.1 sulfite exporter TauE/SafE family protein [Aquabacterium sp. OR-4]
MLPVITDPAFYAVAVPAVLLVGISKSGFGAGFGALGVPLMALAVPVPQAAAIMLPLLAIMDGLGLKALARQADAALLRLLLPAGLAGIVLGWLLFGVLPARAVAGLVGAITLVFLAIRTVFPPRADAPAPGAGSGFFFAAVSGFTSFVAHAGGPPIGFYMLPLKLPPIRFTATLAVFFAAVNAAKWLPYGLLGLIDLTNMGTALVLAPAAPLGVWLGLRIVRVIPQALFYRLFSLGMLLTGIKLVWDALR